MTTHHHKEDPVPHGYVRIGDLIVPIWAVATLSVLAAVLVGLIITLIVQNVKKPKAMYGFKFY